MAELEKEYDVTIITQNIDNLHERAGSTHVIHLHGELMNARSSKDDTLLYPLSEDKCEIKMGDLCEKGSQLRPDVVWFGEAVPKIEEAAKEVKTADIFLVIGTSLNVYPAAGLLHYASSGIPIYLIDPKEVKVNRPGVIHINKGASEGMREFRKMINV